MRASHVGLDDRTDGSRLSPRRRPPWGVEPNGGRPSEAVLADVQRRRTRVVCVRDVAIGPCVARARHLCEASRLCATPSVCEPASAWEPASGSMEAPLLQAATRSARHAQRTVGTVFTLSPYTRRFVRRGAYNARVLSPQRGRLGRPAVVFLHPRIDFAKLNDDSTAQPHNDRGKRAVVCGTHDAKTPIARVESGCPPGPSARALFYFVPESAHSRSVGPGASVTSVTARVAFPTGAPPECGPRPLGAPPPARRRPPPPRDAARRLGRRTDAGVHTHGEGTSAAGGPRGRQRRWGWARTCQRPRPLRRDRRRWSARRGRPGRRRRATEVPPRCRTGFDRDDPALGRTARSDAGSPSTIMPRGAPASPPRASREVGMIARRARQQVRDGRDPLGDPFLWLCSKDLDRAAARVRRRRDEPVGADADGVIEVDPRSPIGAAYASRRFHRHRGSRPP